MALKFGSARTRAVGETEAGIKDEVHIVHAKTGPIHTVKFGKVQATIWRNETKHGPRFNVTVNRLYLEDEIWKRSDSFGRDELLTAARAFESAYDWIWTQRKTADESGREDKFDE